MNNPKREKENIRKKLDKMIVRHVQYQHRQVHRVEHICSNKR
jgi:hypothetical protein